MRKFTRLVTMVTLVGLAYAAGGCKDRDGGEDKAAKDKDGDGAAIDKGKLEGTWALQGMEMEGDKVGAPPALSVTFSGGNMTWKEKDKEIPYSFTLDTSKDPKRLDTTPSGGGGTPLHGIYAFDGDDRLMIAAPLWMGKGVDVEKERPTAFTTKKGSGYVVMTFRREKK